MSVQNVVAQSIRKYGGSVIIQNGSEKTGGKAFIEPLRYRNKIYVGGELHSLGTLRREKYLFIGTPDSELFEDVTVIESGSRKYIVKRCELYYVGDSPIYVWAILAEYGQKAEDDFDDQ
jgi:hypothetical protein